MPGEETVLDRAADVEMSEDSGYTGSGCSVTTDSTLASRVLQSESGDSTHTGQCREHGRQVCADSTKGVGVWRQHKRGGVYTHQGEEVYGDCSKVRG